MVASIEVNVLAQASGDDGYSFETRKNTSPLPKKMFSYLFFSSLHVNPFNISWMVFIHRSKQSICRKVMMM